MSRQWTILFTAFTGLCAVSAQCDPMSLIPTLHVTATIEVVVKKDQVPQAGESVFFKTWVEKLSSNSVDRGTLFSISHTTDAKGKTSFTVGHDIDRNQEIFLYVTVVNAEGQWDHSWYVITWDSAYSASISDFQFFDTRLVAMTQPFWLNPDYCTHHPGPPVTAYEFLGDRPIPPPPPPLSPCAEWGG